MTIRGDRQLNTPIRQGYVLEHGPATTTLINQILSMRPDDIRPGDLEELVDFLTALGYGPYEIARDFGMLLTLALGMQKDSVRTYTITYDGQPLFVATLTRSGQDVVLMSGFGLQRGYQLLTRREIYNAIECLFDLVISDMREVFKVEHAVCHVKNTNTQTLMMWRYMARHRKDVSIGEITDPFTRDYTLVTLSLGESYVF